MMFHLTPSLWHKTCTDRAISVIVGLLLCLSGVSCAVTFQVHIPEERPPGFVVGNLSRYTINYGSYKLGQTKHSNYFAYDKETGIINTTRVIDRDDLSGPCVNGSEFGRLLFEHSSKLNDVISAKVIIYDINDNTPEFTTTARVTSIREDSNIGDIFPLTTATDKDCGLNGTIVTYRISGGYASAGPFGLQLSTDGKGLSLVLKQVLDRETNELYVLNVSACDGGVPQRCAFSMFNVTVGDYNDNKPKFHDVPSVVKVKENCESGTNVTTLKVTDADSGANAMVHLSVKNVFHSGGLQNDELRKLFEIDSSSKELRTSKCLTYDQANPSYTVVIEAKDQGVPVQHNDITIQVDVVDVNDHYPELYVHLYLPIKENESKQTIGVIYGIDKDDGQNKNMSLNIVSGNLNSKFYLVRPTQATIFFLKLNGTLDHEMVSQYNITIEAFDHGDPPLSTEKNIVIPVTDVNDNAPICWISPGEIVITENSPVGTYVTNIHAMDKDQGTNGEVKYLLVDQKTLFQVVESTGLVTTNGILDFETHHSIEVTVIVQDQGNPQLSTNCSFVVNVTDVNDNTPRFLESTYNIDIQEDLPVHSVVISLAATDADGGYNAHLTYDMVSALPLTRMTFDLNNSTGEVRLLRQLDRETYNFYQFVVMVSDHGIPALSSTVSVSITIMDVNDNHPVIYPKRYFLNPFHNQSDGFVANVTATDYDSGENGTVSYEIVNGELESVHFNIDNETGIITTDYSLLDSSKPYSLKIIARDGPGLVSNVSTVHITFITPMEDLPYFEMDSYLFVIEENVEVGTYVGKIKGEIKLPTETISYLLYNGDPEHVFSINSIGEIRTSKELDSEDKRMYNLQVLVKTMGQRVLIGWTTVKVVVEDVNDNAPQFQYSHQVVAIKDNIQVGTIIYQARATDPDLGDAGIVKYDLSCESNQKFEINSQTGDVSIREHLSVVGNATILLRVTASDSGLPNLTSILHVTVDVAKVNDIPPVFQTICTLVPLARDMPINSIFFNVTASDPDGGNGTVYFELSSLGNEMGYFGIFPNGAMFVRQSLILADESLFTLKVIATDTGYPPLTSSSYVNVSLFDLNDHPAFFKRSTYRFQIYENEKPGTLVGTLDLQGDQDFTIALLNEHEEFSFDNTKYEIRTRKTLDREKLTGSCFILYLQASYKNQLQSNVQIITVHIKIQDQNDNKPVFTPSQYLVHVEENQPTMKAITKLMASDNDEGENSKVNYSILYSSCAEVFGITREGDVVLKKTLENANISHCNLTVQALNIVPPYYNSTCHLEITVDDVNNNAPMFKMPWININLKENLPTGQRIFQVTAHDRDTGRNSRLAYIISKGNSDGVFKLDRKTGEISLLRELDFETNKRFVLNITAIDSGVPSLSSSQELVINVTDFNDNTPQFQECVSEVAIFENTTVGTEIGKCIANDIDSGRNGMVSYRISREKPRGSYFSINSNTGTLSVRNVLDRELVPYHKVYITAHDQALPVSSQLSSTKVITIFLNDTNDNAPTFTSPAAVAVQPSLKKGGHVITLTARDLDIGANSKVMFKQRLVGDFEYFNVWSDGQVTLKQIPTFDRLYYLHVVTIDLGNPQRNTSQIVTVFGEGKNELVFSQQQYSASILENEASGKDITKLSVTAGSNNIQYFITNDSSGGLVLLNPKTGVISTKVPLNREGTEGQEINLVVYAVDTKSKTPKTGSTTVRITILDQNDNVPTFSEDVYVKDLQENVKIDSKILTLIARDGDQGRNGSVSYRITGGNTNRCFRIDHTTGDLFLSRELDYELNTSYALNITAVDDGQSPLSSWCVVVINVLDVNDNAPVFRSTDYSFGVMENSPVGTLVGIIAATDVDFEQNGKVFYRLSGEDSGLFSMNPQTGVMRTSSMFDREKVSVYVVKVIASDLGKPRALSAHTFVYVSILDENDNNPEFYNDQPLTVSVSEDSPIGTSIATLKASDKDFGVNSKLTYFISGGNEDKVFSISSNGTIVTKSLLDRESTPFYDISVTVSDMPRDYARRRFTTTSVRVRVLDVNDGTPYFVSPDVIHLREDQKVGVTFTTVVAVDSDAGPNGQLLYELQGVLAKSFFLINRYTGALSLKKTMDREHLGLNHVNISIEAKDLGQPAKFTRRDVMIVIDDVNDNSPIFSPHKNQVMVYENISIGTALIILTASDVDQGRNGQVEYAITTGNVNNTFFIHPIDGVITLVKPLDRESFSYYHLNIEASDFGEPRMRTSTELDVVVLDINDNPPHFQVIYITKKVKENTPSIPNLCTFVASDDDEGQNGNITYHIAEKGIASFLQIDSETGQVSLVSPLDRESKSTYSIPVQARDNGHPQLFALAYLTIIVEDKNDNGPVFLNPNMKCSIFEGSPIGSTLCIMNATDADIGKNGHIIYELVYDFSRYKINAATGEISTVAELDRELHGSEFKLTVKAKDQGSPQRESFGKVIGRILDVDDNKATFEKKQYTAYIPLKSPSGTFVTVVRATDLDEGINGSVIYALSTQSSLFRIEQTTGNILTKSSIPSSSSQWQLKVQALNARTKIEEDIATVDVTATSANFPVFQIPVTVFHIPEDEKRGFVILRAEATDDTVVAIASGNDNEQFSLDFTSRNLTLKKELDYETERIHSLWLKATVNTDYSTYVNIQVFVDDVNDNKPEFQKTYYQFYLNESSAPDSTVGTITAKDEDSGPFGVVEYSIVEASAQPWIYIDNITGVIYTKREIDREKNSSFRFTARAEDHGVPRKMDEVPVLVTIVDVNDNAPVFDAVAPVYVPENTTPGSVLTKVNARDADEHSDFQYTLLQTGNYNKTFSVQTLTGEVVLEKKLDREKIEKYILTIRVTDQKYTSEISVNVIIEDIDDNPPVFEESLYEISIPELLPVGSFVAKINVTDYDEVGPHTATLYSFQRTPVSDKFRINFKGIITVASVFTYVPSDTGDVHPNQYDLTVLAWSPAHQHHKATTMVRILLTDANDHRPVFEKNVYFAYVPSVSKKGTRVGSVNARDIYDVGKNREVQYKAVGGNGTNFFNVELNSGNITVKADLTSLVDKVFALDILASDRGEPVQISNTTAKVYITITVENQHPPVFQIKKYQKNLVENCDVGTEFLRVKATDKDKGVNGKVSYSILPGKQSEYFTINPNNGSVSVGSRLDYEYRKTYAFDVQARDGAHQPKSDIATVEVTVDDYNDNPPVFETCPYNVDILENSPVGSDVGVVRATDKDTVGNTITYALDGQNKDHFMINKNTGAITTKTSLDYESTSVYRLIVVATDSGDPQKKAGCPVVVSVVGVNEFSPRFSQKQYIFVAAEDFPMGKTVGKVSATDDDKGYDGVIRYMFVDPSKNKYFNINETTGEIFVVTSLDSESVPRVNLTVLAKNPGSIIFNAGNTDITGVIVDIEDSNDPPRFLQQFSKTSVSEDVPKGTQVGNLSAVDDDVKADFNSPFVYRIRHGNVGNSFRIIRNRDFAIFVTNKLLDRETVPLFNLTIAAIDTTTPSLVGTATLIIEILDVNDNAPVLKPGICPGLVKENQVKGTVVAQLDAIDADIDPNKDPYTFQIMNNEDVPFMIKGSELKTSMPLDREKTPSYNLTIQVKDSGFPKKSSICFCQINVEDMNDNPPSAETRQVTINVPRTGFNDESVGDVSPVDADEVNLYSCKVEGTLYKDVFSFQPGSCILHVKKSLSTFYVLNVHASDESNRVSYSLNISFNIVPDRADEKSVILRLTGIPEQRVLTVINTIQCVSGYHQQILSIRQVSEFVIDVLLVYSKNGAYIPKNELLELLKRCKNDMERQFGASIYLDYNLCSSSNPCINGVCAQNVTLLPENRTTLYSKTHVFVSMYHRPTAHCRCHNGFTGTRCEYSTKPCLGKPCRNNGKCISTGVGFVCQCQPNFAGDLCEISVNLCNPNPCSNASVCISSPKGPKCQCDFGARGDRCELGSFGFYPLSYIKLPTLAKAEKNGRKVYNISLQFSTVQRNALILLNQNGKEGYRSRFIAIEIIEGRLSFSFSLGDVTRRLVADNPVVADGQWHSVTAVKDKQVGYLNVDGKVYRSVNAGDSLSSTENLELEDSPLYLGGISSLDIVLSNDDQVQSYDFIGCMRDIYFGGKMFDQDDALVNHDVISRCPRLISEAKCEDQGCKQGSNCIDRWFTGLCQCKLGTSCSHDSKQLVGGSVLQFHFDPSYLRAQEFQERKIALPSRRRRDTAHVQTMSLRARSRHPNAFLWRTQDAHGNYSQLLLNSSYVVLTLGSVGQSETDKIVSGVKLETGAWFNVTVSRGISRNSLTLTVDDNHNTTYPKQPYLFLSGTWTFGNFGQGNDSPLLTFDGCLSTITINDEVLSVNISNQYGKLVLEKGSLIDGCEAPDYCSSNPCPGTSSRCVNHWQTYTCVAARSSGSSLSVGAIAAIVFFIILIIAIVVAVIAVKKRRTKNFFDSTFSKKTNVEAEHDNSRGSSSSESIPSRKTQSRNSLDSGVEVHNTTTSLSSRELARNASAHVISLGSPDEYTIVTSRRDSESDQRDTGFTDSECEFGLTNRGANLTISSIPSNVDSSPSQSRKSRDERSTLNYSRKVPYLINRGYLNDTRRPSRSTTASGEGESIEMQNYSIDVDEAEHYSIGDASLATYSDIYPGNVARSLDTDRIQRYRPSLEHFSESDDSVDERQLSNLDHTLENFESGEISSVSSDGGFTVSEYDYERRPSYEQNSVRLNHQSSKTEESAPATAPREHLNVYDSINNESSVDGDMSWDDVTSWGANYNDANEVRRTCLAIAQLENDDQHVEIV